MFRILALVALLIGLRYLGTGNCGIWWNSQLLSTELATVVMFCLYFSVLFENLFKNKVFNGVLSIVGAVWTSIYWYVWVWSDIDAFACRGPNAILIGGITMFSLFLINFLMDFVDHFVDQEETRKEIED